MSNAIKYTNDGYVKLIVKNHPDTIQFIVQDTGLGIKKENMSKLFNAFGKVEDQENKTLNPNGVGLGLVMS